MHLPLSFLFGAVAFWLPAGLLGFASAKPAPVFDDRYFSVNNASLSSFHPLDKRQDCSVNPVYCAGSGGYCSAGSSCCYNRCCVAGYACRSDGLCYPDVVYTYCYTTTWYTTTTVPSVRYSTVYSTTKSTRTSWSTTTSTIRTSAATRTIWSTVTRFSKRHAPLTPAPTPAALPPPPTTPTNPPIYSMAPDPPSLRLRRLLEAHLDPLLHKRVAYVTITVVYTSTSYSYVYSTSYSTQTVTSGTIDVLATYTTTAYSGASATYTVTSTTTVRGEQRNDDGGGGPTPVPVPVPVPVGGGRLSVGEIAGVVVGSIVGAVSVGVAVFVVVKGFRQGGSGGGGGGWNGGGGGGGGGGGWGGGGWGGGGWGGGGGAGGGGAGGGGAGGGGAGGGGAGGGGAGGAGAGGAGAGGAGAGGAGAGGNQEPKDKEPVVVVADAASPPYNELPVGQDEIRILILDSGTLQGTLRATLKRIYIGKDSRRTDRGEYEAISYSWEQDAAASGYVSKVKLEGKIEVRMRPGAELVELPVKKNLETALRYLRLETGRRSIWTDELCIDQKHEAEKKKQMELMGLVYSGAKQVIGWLGENETYLAALVETVRDVGSISTVSGMLPDGTLAFESEQDPIVKELAREMFTKMTGKDDMAAIARIAGLRFWKRRWILQEVALAKSLVLQMGSTTFSWYLLIVLLEMIDTERVHRTDDFHVVLSNARILHDQEIRLNTLRRGIRPMQLLKRQREWGAQFPLLDLVQTLRGWGCGEPADRVNALLGLIPKHDLDDNRPTTIAPDIDRAFKLMGGDPDFCDEVRRAYKKIINNDKKDTVKEYCGVIEVYGTLVHGFAHRYGKLDGLNFNNSERLRYFPSWLPNFHAPKNMFSLIEGVPINPANWLSVKRPTYKAAGDTTARLHRFGDPVPAFLASQGRPVDVVRHVAKEAFDCPTVDSVDAAIERLHTWTKATSPTIDSWETLSRVYDDYDEAVRFTSVAGLTTRRDQEAPVRAQREDLSPLDVARGPGIFHRMSRKHPGPVFRAQCGRRPFVTHMGYIGIGPANTEPGDTVCILNGGQTPYVVRGVDGARWNFIGECYVHGVMGGEVLSSWPEEKRKDEGTFTFV